MTLKSIFLIPIIALSSFLFTPHATKDEVYLCMGSRSYAYHLYKDYRAFDRCTTKIYSMTLKEAVSDKKRKLCNWCKKR
jgi:hypothetical protein